MQPCCMKPRRNNVTLCSVEIKALSMAHFKSESLGTILSTIVLDLCFLNVFNLNSTSSYYRRLAILSKRLVHKIPQKRCVFNNTKLIFRVYN